MLLAGVVVLEDRRSAGRRAAALVAGAAGGGVILLFLLLNIEIADYYATGPTIMFRFGVTLAQDLTYTIGWLVFGMVLLGGRHRHRQPAGARRGRGAHRGDDVQVLPLRPRLARGPVPRRLVRRPGDVARAGVARAAEVRAVEAEERHDARAPVAMLALIVVALGAIVARRSRTDRLRGSSGRVDDRRHRPAPPRDRRGAARRRLAVPRRAPRGRAGGRGRPGDLRLVTDSGAPVPYLLVYPSQPGSGVDRRLAALDSRRRRKTSGFEVDLGAQRQVDATQLASGPAGAVPEAGAARGQRRPRALDDAGRGRHAVRSAGRTAAPGHAAVHGRRVSLPARHLGRHATAAAAAAVTARARLALPHAPLSAATLPVVVERRPSEPGVSRYRLTLPAARRCRSWRSCSTSAAATSSGTRW